MPSADSWAHNDVATEARLRRRAAREREARLAAERLLEDKSRELFHANTTLAEALEQAWRATEENRRLAHFDALTGLPNRLGLFEWLDKAWRALAGCSGGAVGLLHVDLDRFKLVNDTQGHTAGDQALSAAAFELRRLAAEQAPLHSTLAGCGLEPMVARLSGDEFVLAGCLPGSGDDPRAFFSQLAQTGVTRLEHLRFGDGRERAVGASIGVSLRHSRDAMGDPAALLIEADQALYRAKSQGGGAYVVFDEALRATTEAKRRVAAALPDALCAGSFEPFYQPQVDATTFEIVGAEALARWRRADGATLSPAAFLECAKELNLVHAIDDAICRAALADLQRWRGAGLELPKLSVNVSASRLSDPNLLEGLAALSSDRRGLSFELLETMLLDEIDETTRCQLDAIAEAGIAIEIDDFGSGHASIIGLMRVGPSRIKLDRELVAPLDRCDSHRGVLRSVVEMARAMGVKVTAEGVETAAQARILADIGVDTLQGFLFSRPMPAPAFEAMLRAKRDFSFGAAALKA